MDKYHRTNPPTELKSAVLGRENSRKGSAASSCYLEVEVCESRRRYLTVEVTPEMAEKICEWTLKYNPTADEESAAIAAVKAAKLIKEEIMSDVYELGSVDFPENSLEEGSVDVAGKHVKEQGSDA